MTFYFSLKFLHLIAAFALVGPLMLAPMWLYLYRHEIGRKALHQLHLLTGISGWVVFISGGVILYLQNWSMISLAWMQVSIGLFLAIQLFDHFWSDRQEEALEQNPECSVTALKIWLVIKLCLYGLITFVMVLKPSFV